MNERIKILRKMLDLTQQEFAERVGTKRNTIANYEIKRNEPSNSMIALICREFHVNEEWLRNGTGEIFQSKPSNALDALAEERNLSVGTYVLIEKILNLKPEMQEAFVNLALDIATTINQMNVPVTDPVIRQKLQNSGFAPIGQVAPAAQYPDDWERAELHRLLDEQLDEEEGRSARQEVS